MIPYCCYSALHGISYMPSRLDTAGHTKVFHYPVMDHWVKVKVTSFHEFGHDPNTCHYTVHDPYHCTT